MPSSITRNWPLSDRVAVVGADRYTGPPDVSSASSPVSLIVLFVDSVSVGPSPGPPTVSVWVPAPDVLPIVSELTVAFAGSVTV